MRLKSAEAQVESDRKAAAVAEAAIQQAEAALETARINLGYTKITAPISGRIGRSNVTDGRHRDGLSAAWPWRPFSNWIPSTWMCPSRPPSFCA